jgi:hypothetical protein
MRGGSQDDAVIFRTILPHSPRLMRMHNLVMGLGAVLVLISQAAEAQTVVTRIYNQKELERYALDPPFWTYHAEGWCHSKSAHWLYANHRCVFIDIKMDVVDSQ